MNELKEAIRAKTIELETALELGLARDELLKIYKQLKELQFQKVQEELRASPPAQQT